MRLEGPQFRSSPALLALLLAMSTTGCADLGSGVGVGDTEAADGDDGDDDDDDDAGDDDDDDDTDGAANDEGGDFEFADAQDADEVDYLDDLDNHPGCTTAGLGYDAASIEGFRCAAKAYGGDVDTDKPIVLLVHGNSDSPVSWEAFDPMGACEETFGDEGNDMLAEMLVANGFETYAVDMRFDQVDDPDNDNETQNAAKNMDHGWGVPIAAHFIRTAMEANPDRRFVVMGFSFGVTTVRDALRRLLVNEGFNAFAQLDHAILLSGANHGVSSFPLCSANPTRRGVVTCEMGDRAAYSPTYFTSPLNGPEGDFETPCSEGEDAFGEAACDGAKVQYTTIVMEDLEGGEQQDLFVSEASAALAGADNVTVGLNDFDKTGYFVCGLFRNHFGSYRSGAGLDAIADKLGI